MTNDIPSRLAKLEQRQEHVEKQTAEHDATMNQLAHWRASTEGQCAEHGARITEILGRVGEVEALVERFKGARIMLVLIFTALMSMIGMMFSAYQIYREKPKSPAAPAVQRVPSPRVSQTAPPQPKVRRK